jgi:outer membrane immunogenic protein
MKRFLVGCVGALAFGGVPALAADMAVKAPPPPVPAAPVYSWTGFYIGINAGAGYGANTSTFSGFTAIDNPPPVSPNGWGGVIGGQAGYNYQFGNWVAGVEADIDYAHFGGNAVSVSVTNSSDPTTQNVDWLGTARARLGVLAIDKLLVFATGGLAFGRVTSSSSSLTSGGCNISCGFGSMSSTRTGWTVGGGAEYALTNQISFKAEYLYADLGSLTYSFPVTAAVSLNTTASQFRANIARAGFNLKFN